jgi:cholesterol oxidase
MPGWYGKRFDAQGKGINLLQRNGKLEPVVPMDVRVEPSKLDGKPAAVVHYPATSQFPWHFVLDELRAWEGATLLGMTFVDVPVLRGMPLPFLIHRV